MRLALLFLITIVVTGCSSFESAWRKAPASSTDLSGRWEGRWQSGSGKHHGTLRAIITPASPGRYHARFRATYPPLLAANYSVYLEARKRGKRTEFSGAADLGIWGRYETKGHATPTAFHATYRSRFDRGTFEMLRPQPASR